MRDDFSDWVPADTVHVSIADPWDLDYWTRYFQVNGNRLRRALACVGTRRVDILANLSGNGRTLPQTLELDAAVVATVERHASAQMTAQADPDTKSAVKAAPCTPDGLRSLSRAAASSC